jgi:hypothetical protein
MTDRWRWPAQEKMCSGGMGAWVGGIVLVRDQLGVIAQGAAAAAPRLVTAAVPRDLRIDPCEKRSKRDELRRVGQRSVDGRRRGSRKHDGCYLLLRERRGEVRENMRFRVGDAPRSFSYNPPRGLCEYA